MTFGCSYRGVKKALDFVDQQPTADNLRYPVSACRWRVAASVYHGPVRAAVFHRCCAIRIPRFDMHDLSDIQIDIAIGTGRWRGGPSQLPHVPATHSAPANRCGNQQP